MGRLFGVAYCVSAMALAGCASPYSVRKWDGSSIMPPRPDPNELVGLSVSGGGSRAATFTANVLEELAKVRVAPGDAQPSLIERIQYISSVSGGSVATAYYGLNKPERSEPVLDGGGRLTASYQAFFDTYRADMARDYEKSFFGHYLQDATKRGQALIEAWSDGLAFDGFSGRRAIFGHRTFAELYEREKAGNSPKLVINGTSWNDGRRFVFTTLPKSEFETFEFTEALQKDLDSRAAGKADADELRKRAKNEFFTFKPRTFEDIGGDVASVPVAVAVAASSSVPLVIGPVMLEVAQGGAEDGRPRKIHHIGDGGMFDNQGIESLAQLMFPKLTGSRKGLVIVVDASYPFGASDEELGRARSAADLLALDPSRISDIMEQRARSYQLLLWTSLRSAARVVPTEESLRMVYLRHTDVDESILDAIPAGCSSTYLKDRSLAGVKALLARIPTRFDIDKECHAPLLAAAAANVVRANRAALLAFFQERRP